MNLLPISIDSLNPDIPFKKHSAAIHIQGQLSFVDHKILNVLYKCAYDRDQCNGDYHYVRISDIVQFLGWKKRVKSEIAQSLNQLRISGINYNIFGQDKLNEDDWEQAGSTGFIGSYKVDDANNFVRFSLSPEIKSMLKKPNIYAVIDIRNQQKLKTKYELIFYEYFVEELYRNNRSEMVTRWYSINDLRRMLNIPSDAYSDFKFFNRDCIVKSLKNINESDIGFHVEVNEVERINRKVVAMNFKISLVDGKDFVSDQVTLPLEVEDSIILDIKYEAVEELLSLFQSDKIIKTIISEIKKKFGNIDLNLYLINNIEYSKKKADIGAVSNFLGYLRSCLANDYAGYVEKCNRVQINRQKEEDDKMKIELQNKISEEVSKTNSIEFNNLSEEVKKLIIEKCKESVYQFEKQNDEIKELTLIEYYVRNKKDFKYT